MLSNHGTRIRQVANWLPAVLCAVTLLAALNFSRRTPWATPPPAVATVPSEQTVKHDLTLPIPPQTVILGFVDLVQIKVSGEEGIGPVLAGMGWATSSASSVPLKKVVMLVDGKPVAETDAFSLRPDVATAYDRPDFSKSGWWLTVPVREPVAIGRKLTFQAVNSDGYAIDLPNHDGSRFSIIGK